MKKGLVFVMLSMIIFFVGIALADVLCPVDNEWTTTECVCGHTPNSSIGYGQVIIGGSTPTVISCNNELDGICPEDFQDPDTLIVGNCTRCPDPDCTVNGTTNSGYVWGYVKDVKGKPIEQAIVTGNPIKWNNSEIMLNRTTVTDGAGKYNYTGFITGVYYFSASKSSYDTELLQTEITRGGITNLNFTLLNGTCHEDCTNSYNRCNKACDGVTFNGSDNKCEFYYDADYTPDIKTLCNNKPEGTSVKIRSDDRNNATHSYYVDCCEGIPYPKYDAKIRTRNNNIENLVKNEQIVTYNGEASVLEIIYW